MCGRIACTLNPDAICKACSYQDKNTNQKTCPTWQPSPDGHTYKTSYNMPPGSYTPVLIANTGEVSNRRSSRLVQPMRWGLVPSWYRGTLDQFTMSTSNARSEGLTTKASFKPALNKGQRCVVLADGFFEWKKIAGSNRKQPYFIHDDGKPLLMMAGIFDISGDPQNPLYSYSVITVNSVGSMSDIHDRMPAMLTSQHEVNTWLNSKDISAPEALRSCIHSVKTVAMYPVSTVVNNARYDSKECILPLLENKTCPQASNSFGFMDSWLKSGVPATQHKILETSKRFHENTNFDNDVKDIKKRKSDEHNCIV